MALVKCKECGKEISDSAERCVHCGYKERTNNTEASPLSIAAMIVSIAGIFIDFYCLVTITGLILSFNAFNQIPRYGTRTRNYACIGALCGIISLFIRLVLVIIKVNS